MIIFEFIPSKVSKAKTKQKTWIKHKSSLHSLRHIPNVFDIIFHSLSEKKNSSVKYCNIKMLFELNANSLKMKLLHYTIQEHKEHKMDIDFVFFFFSFS